jgi:DNA-binding transcriptional ArsR family regulator
MSLGDDGDAKRLASLRAMAHPVRLQILSLLTGASLTAAEVARELGLTHANASYHLRNLLHGGLLVPDGEERIRGGVAKRYRYQGERDRGPEKPRPLDAAGAEAQRALLVAFANELIRRTAEADLTTGAMVTDAELWVTPEAYQEVRDKITEASRALHQAAQAPRTPGTVRTSTTVAMFRMEDK